MGYWDTHPVIEDAKLVTPSFHPTFREAFVTDGIQVWGLNRDYFADFGTAQWIANKYGTGQVFEAPYEGQGGPFNATANVYLFKLASGQKVNAGIIAAYYVRNPEDKFPGLAETLIRMQLGI